MAATAVVIFHSGRSTTSLAWGLPLWNHANVAVSFFFALSGFILAAVYQERRIRRPADFYLARLARIGPVYWLALSIVAAYRLQRQQLDPAALLQSALMVQSWIPGRSQVLNTPGWSLSVEMFFYLLFPFLLRALSPMRSRALALTAAGTWVVGQAVFVFLSLFELHGAQLRPRLHDFTCYGPLLHFPTFVVGAAGGLLFIRYRDRLRTVAVPFMLASLGLFLAFMLVPNPVVRFHHDGLFAPLFILFVVGLGSAPDLAVSRLFARRSFVLLGEASYGVYILQYPMELVFGVVTRRGGFATNVRFWSFYVVLVTVALVCFRWIEAPLRSRIMSWYGYVVARESVAT
jgi:peptidoglycan/LPS O-acetylase OafA/YrhL